MSFQFRRSDLPTIISLCSNLLQESVDNNDYDVVSQKIGMLDLYSEEGEKKAFQLEEFFRARAYEKAGFLRHSQVYQLLGYSGNGQLSRLFREVPNSTDKIRKLAGETPEQETTINWEERPDDNFIYSDVTPTGVEIPKTAFGWPLNTFISEFLPWIKGREVDRIIPEDKKHIYKPNPVTMVVGNSKGGSEKTTETVHLAITAALTGQKVLVADGDPQSTASSLLGYPWSQETRLGLKSLRAAVLEVIARYNANTKEYELDDFDPSYYIRPTNFEGVSIITGATTGQILDHYVAEHPNAIAALYARIKEICDFDIIMVDTRPSSIYQDLAQYRSADILVNTMPANTPGIASTKLGLNNYLSERINLDGGIADRKNQIIIVVPTCVDSNQAHMSHDVMRLIQTESIDPLLFPNILDSGVPKSKQLADASLVMETAFQQTAATSTSSSTKPIITAYLSQLVEIFQNGIFPHWLLPSGQVLDPELVMNYVGDILDPLRPNEEPKALSKMEPDTSFIYFDAGFAYAIERLEQPCQLVKSVRGKSTVTNNPMRFLKASDLGLDEGYQVIMHKGQFIALAYDLDAIESVDMYVHHANSSLVY